MSESLGFLQPYEYPREACFREWADTRTACPPYTSAEAVGGRYLHTQCAPGAQQTAGQPAGTTWGPGLASGPYSCTAGPQTARRRRPPRGWRCHCAGGCWPRGNSRGGSLPTNSSSSCSERRVFTPEVQKHAKQNENQLEENPGAWKYQREKRKFDKSSVKINNACQAKKAEEEVRT